MRATQPPTEDQPLDPLTESALLVQDDLQRNGPGTLREMAERTGATVGALRSGAMRLKELDLVMSKRLEQRGRPWEFTLVANHDKQLIEQIPRMRTYLGRAKLKVRNASNRIKYLERLRSEEEDEEIRRELSERIGNNDKLRSVWSRYILSKSGVIPERKKPVAPVPETLPATIGSLPSAEPIHVSTMQFVSEVRVWISGNAGAEQTTPARSAPMTVMWTWAQGAPRYGKHRLHL